MIVLGLLLLIVVAIVSVTMVARGRESVRVDLDSLGTFETDAATVFLLGATTVLVGVLGVAILLAGVRAGRRRRAKVRDLQQRARRGDEIREREASRSDGDSDIRADPAPRDP